jgi:2-polyprenyl-6-methoxyphenol hydroxylase-like FAD-dependent oxidoreductase
VKRALIVGGGPAGCSAALALVARGVEVTLLEQNREWNGRVCGSFLNAEAAGHLRRLGLWEDALAAGAVRVSSTLVTTPAGSVSLVPTEDALAIPRKDLETMLLAAVRRAGGDVRLGTRATSYRRTGAGWTVNALRRDDRAHDGAAEILKAAPQREELSCDLLCLADGRFSLAAPAKKPGAGWFGWNALFDGAAQAPGGQSLHFYRGGYVGVVTYADGTSNVCGLFHQEAAKGRRGVEAVYEEAMERQPPLRGLLANARRIGEWRGVGPLPHGLRPRWPAGPLALGDVAAVGDPFMGEGIGRALGAGPLLADALDRGAGSPEALGRAYRRLWSRRYPARLRAGWAARTGLRSRALFPLLIEPLLRRPRLLAALTPLFHSS